MTDIQTTKKLEEIEGLLIDIISTLEVMSKTIRAIWIEIKGEEKK